MSNQSTQTINVGFYYYMRKLRYGSGYNQQSKYSALGNRFNHYDENYSKHDSLTFSLYCRCGLHSGFSADCKRCQKEKIAHLDRRIKVARKYKTANS